MQTAPVREQPLPAKENRRPPYAPSWVDRLTDWTERMPGPSWAYYAGLWILLVIIEAGSKWLDGVEPFPRLRWTYVIYSFYGVYFLAAIDYLDIRAKNAFARFRPVLARDEEGQALLLHQLITMPARPVWFLSAAMLASQILLMQILVIPLWTTMGFRHHSTAAVVVDLGIYGFNAIMVGIFIYHTLRQLNWISRIHGAASRVNLFRLRPVYSLSGLTARTAGILILLGIIIQQQTISHGVWTSDPYALRMSSLFTLTSVLVFSLLAAAAFLLPLLGLHNLLVREKERLQAEASSRLQAHIQELHQRVDARKLKEADSIYFLLMGLASERDILSKLPTWPWQPGTLNIILTAVLLPILLWITQQVLGRWAGLR